MKRIPNTTVAPIQLLGVLIALILFAGCENVVTPDEFEEFVDPVVEVPRPAWQQMGIGMDGPVWGLSLYGGELIAGGSFANAGESSANHIARWDGMKWNSMGAGMSGGDGVQVRAISVYRENVIAGGRFTDAGGVDTQNIARWDGAEWQALGAGLSYGSVPVRVGSIPVRALTVYNEDLIAAGTFTSAGTVRADRMARWDGSEWQAMGTGMSSGVEVWVEALAVYNDDLIAAGYFTEAGGVTANNIARWDGSAWHPMGIGVNGAVAALTVHEGDLIAAGFFYKAGGRDAERVARWDGSEWHPVTAELSEYPPTVRSLAVHNGDLIAGGRFTLPEGDADFVVRWEGSGWRPIGKRMNSFLFTLTVYDGALIAGGNFTSSDGAKINHIARWNAAEDE